MFFFFLAPFLFFKIYTPNFEKFFPSFLFTLEKCDMQNRSNSNQTWKFLLLGRKEKKRRQKLLKRFFVYNFLVSLVLYFWWLVWESCYRRGEEGEANFCSFVWLQSVFIRNALLFFFFFHQYTIYLLFEKKKLSLPFIYEKFCLKRNEEKKLPSFFFLFSAVNWMVFFFLDDKMVKLKSDKGKQNNRNGRLVTSFQIPFPFVSFGISGYPDNSLNSINFILSFFFLAIYLFFCVLFVCFRQIFFFFKFSEHTKKELLICLLIFTDNTVLICHHWCLSFIIIITINDIIITAILINITHVH